MICEKGSCNKSRTRGERRENYLNGSRTFSTESTTAPGQVDQRIIADSGGHCAEAATAAIKGVHSTRSEALSLQCTKSLPKRMDIQCVFL
jgi:hypothetical protein